MKEIYLLRKIRLNISHNFYLRTGFTVTTINEWLRRFHPSFTGDSRNWSKFADSKKEFFISWMNEINNHQLSQSEKLSWEVVSIKNPRRQLEILKRDSRKGWEIIEDHMHFPTMPAYIQSSKQFILNARSEKAEIFDKIKDEILGLPLGKTIQSLNINLNIWYYDWNSGGTDIDITFEIPANRLESQLKHIRTFTYQVKDVINKSLADQSIYAKIGEILYTSFKEVLGQEKDPPNFPPSEDGCYAKKYSDYTKSLILTYRRSKPQASEIEGYSKVAMESIRNVFVDFCSDVRTELESLDGPNERVPLIYNGYNGNCILISDRQTPEGYLQFIRTIWVWKVANFYTAGLSKLLRRLVLYNLKLARFKKEDWLQGEGQSDFRNGTELDKFPEFKARKITYLNEMRFDVRADHDLDTHLYANAFKAMKGQQYHKMVSDLLSSISDFIQIKQDNLQLGIERSIDQQNKEEARKWEKERVNRERIKEEEALMREAVLDRERRSGRIISYTAILISTTILTEGSLRFFVGDSASDLERELCKTILITCICFLIPLVLVVFAGKVYSNRRQ